MTETSIIDSLRSKKFIKYNNYKLDDVLRKNEDYNVQKFESVFEKEDKSSFLIENTFEIKDSSPPKHFLENIKYNKISDVNQAPLLSPPFQSRKKNEKTFNLEPLYLETYKEEKSPVPEFEDICQSSLSALREIANLYEQQKREYALQTQLEKEKLEEEQKLLEEEQIKLENELHQKELEKREKDIQDEQKRIELELLAEAKTNAIKKVQVGYGKVKMYEEFMQLKNTVDNDLETFKKDTTIRPYRMSVMKACRLLVSTIQKDDRNFNRNILIKLNKLFNGESVAINDNLTTSIADHPQAKLYGISIVVKAFLEQSGAQISSQPVYGFILASIAVGIWYRNAEFGKLLLANIYKICPILLPFLPNPNYYDDEKEYYKALGFLIENNKIENSKNYFKRATGFIRFFSCLAITPLPESNFSHPFSLENVWNLLVNLCKTPPLTDLIAEVMREIIVVCGKAMVSVYGKQFMKLLVFISKVYLPNLQQSVGGAASISQLETILQDMITNKNFSEIDGYFESWT